VWQGTDYGGGDVDGDAAFSDAAAAAAATAAVAAAARNAPDAPLLAMRHSYDALQYERSACTWATSQAIM
jgi:hypothetical protein